MFQSSVLRPAVGLPLAALVVFGLFSFMNAMISQDYDPPVNVHQRQLVRLTPQVPDTDAKIRPRDKPEKLQTADRPPPPPKLSSLSPEITLPGLVIQGAVPTELPVQTLETFAIDPIAISDRDAQPIRPPIATYPARAAEAGIEGSCDVRFDVDTRGRPYNVDAICTDSVFKREAERAVNRVEFAPKIVRGNAVERRNVVYPLAFRIDG